MTTAAQRAAYQYKYTEPHPSVNKPSNFLTGRGGAGNTTRLCPKTSTEGSTATGPAAKSPTLGPRRLSSGRGGAGNIKDTSKVPNPSEPTIYELERDARHDHEDAIAADKRVWHYGRGGQGNMINQLKPDNGKGRDSASIRSGRSGRSFGSQRRPSVESAISSGSSILEGERKTSRAGSFADRVAQRLGARKVSRDQVPVAVN